MSHDQADYKQKTEEAKNWIENVIEETLEPNNDLRKALEKGVALCKLIQKVKPGLIKTVHEEPKLRFKMMENIQSFLRACRELGVKPTHLFEPVDLYEDKSFHKVVRCIHALSTQLEQKGLVATGIPGASTWIAATEEEEEEDSSEEESSEESETDDSEEEEEEEAIVKKEEPQVEITSTNNEAETQRETTVANSKEHDDDSSEDEDSDSESITGTSEEENEGVPQQEKGEEAKKSENYEEFGESEDTSAPTTDGEETIEPEKVEHKVNTESKGPEQSESSEYSTESSEESIIEKNDQMKADPLPASKDEKNESSMEEASSEESEETTTLPPVPAVVVKNDPLPESEDESSATSEESEEIARLPPIPVIERKIEQETVEPIQENTSNNEKPKTSLATEELLSDSSDEEFSEDETPEERDLRKREELQDEIKRLYKKINNQRERRRRIEYKMEKLSKEVRLLKKLALKKQKQLHTSESNNLQTMTADEPKALKKGYLLKKGLPQESFDWSKQYFILYDNNTFKYYDENKAEGDEQFAHVVNLQSATCFAHVQKKGEQKPNFFNIRTSDRDYLLQASSKEEKNEWVMHFRTQCKKQSQLSHGEKRKLVASGSFIGKDEKDPIASSDSDHTDDS